MRDDGQDHEEANNCNEYDDDDEAGEKLFERSKPYIFSKMLELLNTFLKSLSYLIMKITVIVLLKIMICYPINFHFLK